MVVFGLSRPVQLVWVVAALVTSWDNLVLGDVIFQLTVTGLFAVLQVYSIKIHYKMYQKCGKRYNGFDKKDTVVLGDSNDQEEQPTRVMSNTLMLGGDSATPTKADDSDGYIYHDRIRFHNDSDSFGC